TAFVMSDAAAHYERREYGEASYGSLLWGTERQQLLSVLAELRRSTKRISYLDCAAGTGRVLSYVAPLVDEAAGVEISTEMAAVARYRVPHATVFTGDIASWSSPEAKRYDFITLFRFIL